MAGSSSLCPVKPTGRIAKAPHIIVKGFLRNEVMNIYFRSIMRFVSANPTVSRR